MIRAIIFDLGNVLLHFDHGIIRDRLAQYARRDAFAGARRDIDALSAAFEKGEMTPDTFIARFFELLAVEHPFSPRAFAELWSDIFWKNAPLLALVERLREDVTLVMLSNTNALHIAFAEQHFPEVFEPFAHRLYSHVEHLRKPDPAFFLRAAERAGADLEECLYFDDIQLYVDAASRLGIHAYQYVSVDAARDILAVYELLVPEIAAA
jgi:HAD superfamily hydrolase (TIGR01509 family)